MKKYFAAFAVLASLAAHAQSAVTFKGDFRYRTENIKEEQVSPAPEGDRTRQRIRLRLNAAAQVNEETSVNVRVSTGTAAAVDSTTTNQDLTDYYAKKTLVLDMAYFNWKTTDTVSIWGGKTPIPYYLVGGNDMIFDADLTPEGLSAKYLETFGATDLFLNLSGTWLNERYSATAVTDNTDVGLMGAQIGANYKAESFNVALVLSSYNFSNIKGATAPAAKGNTLVGGLYTQEYKLTAVGLEVGTKLGDLPFSVFAENVSNSDGGNYKTGNIAGFKIGKLKEKKSWMASIDYRELEKDSTLGVISESDSGGGGTDLRSVRFTGGYQVADNVNISLTHMTGKRLISSTVFSPNYNRTQFDFNFNF